MKSLISLEEANLNSSTRNWINLVGFVAIGLFILILSNGKQINCKDENDPEFVSDQTSRLAQNVIESKGYIAQEHVVSPTGHNKLLLIKLVNPLVPNPPRGPVLIAHGILVSALVWVENSDGVEPEDWTWINVETMSLEDLIKTLAGKPASHSLAFLMSNLGFDVWLYNARETAESLLLNQIDLETLQPNPGGDGQLAKPEQLGQLQEDHRGVDFISAITGMVSDKLVPVVTQARASMNSLLETGLTKKFNYWDYSFDELAAIDLPAIIDYILSQTLRYTKIKYVCHSAGCATFLMCVSGRPEYGQKIDNAALFAPALNVENLRYNLFFDAVTALEILLVNTDIPITAALLFQTFMDSVTAICKTKGLSGEYCSRPQGNLEGETFGQNRALKTLLQPISGRELAQLIQSLNKGRMYHFDFGNPFANQHVYGDIVPPVYDLGLVQVRKISIWQGITDALVMVYDTKKIASDLPDSIMVEYHYINNTGIAFNHHSFLHHKQVDVLVNIPALKSLVT